MSFVITTVSPESMVQVSDTRHSALANQETLDDELRKTLIVRGTKAHFVLGWVGLASTDDHHHKTHDWLFKTFYEMNAIELPIEDIAQRLQTSATTHFVNLAALDKRLLLVMAGWQQLEPFICIVSNYVSLKNAGNETQVKLKHHIPSFSEASVAAPEFRGWIQRFDNFKQQHYIVNVMGDFARRKLERHFRGLEGLLKKRAEASKISGACRQIVLEAAMQRPKTIGKNLIGIEMDNTGHTTCSFYSEGGVERMLMPDFLSPEGCYTQGSLSTIVSSNGEVTVRAQAKIAKPLRPRLATKTLAVDGEL